MGGLRSRIAGYLRTGRTLLKAGVSVRSILLYPIRRRLAIPRNQIDLKNGMSIVSPVDEPLLIMLEEIWINRRYAMEDFKICSGHTIVDVGAHVGVFTLWAASADPGARVIAVEPSARMCEFLRRNISRNSLRNVTIVQCACGGENGRAVLYSRGAELANTLSARDRTGKQFPPLAHTEVVTLEALFQRLEVRSCDLLKLDCEGAEYDIVLKAPRNTLEKVQRIAME